MMPAVRTRFDPYAILAALERNYVSYVVIGGLAQVLRGADELTQGVDICPSFASDNLVRLQRAVTELDARRLDGGSLSLTDETLDEEAVISLSTKFGSLQVVGSPAGAPKGYVDLRRAATVEHLGRGLQPLVTSTGDLARMASTLHREHDLERLQQLRRIIELEADPAQTLRERPEPSRQASRSTTRRSGPRATR
jgi:hypothetical protein